MTVRIIQPEIVVNLIRFSGGELHVQLENLPDAMPKVFEIRADIQSSDDLITLLLVHNALQNHYKKSCLINLEIPYFPYARQDRVCAKGQAFSLQVISKMVNDLKVNLLTVWDAHSPATQELTGAINVPQEEIIAVSDKLLGYLQDKNTVLVCPDKGALSKCQAIKDKFSVNDLIFSEKLRNPETGEIIETKLIASDLKGKTAVIADDICDGGRTFIEIAKQLKKRKVGRVILYITHGIFSKGLEVFDDLIDEIYTSNSFPQEENIKLNVIDFPAKTNKRSIKNEL